MLSAKGFGISSWTVLPEREIQRALRLIFQAE